MARQPVATGRIDAEGLKLLNRQLKALDADRADVTAANVAAAETLIRAARPLVPVRSGALVSTLKPAKVQNYAEARGGNSRVQYANPIHWGWSIVGGNHQGKLAPGTIRNIKPEPFFSQALGYTRDEIIANYVRDTQNLIDKYGLGEN